MYLALIFKVYGGERVFLILLGQLIASLLCELLSCILSLVSIELFIRLCLPDL